MVTTVITRAAPNYLLADDAPLSVRRTPGGEAWQARAGQPGGSDGAGPAGAGPGVLLGMPGRGPAAAPAASGVCG
jgi:tRNA-2-methylthio-N6-dimethylallyladenosine synthase